MAAAYISGHLDLTEDEFKAHYAPLLDAAVGRGDVFVVGDAPGADRQAQRYLSDHPVPVQVTVYHMFEKPRCYEDATFGLRGGFPSDGERDAAMTQDSDYDIAWVRPGRENSGTARNLKRRNNES
jgi:hypothetical protein